MENQRILAHDSVGSVAGVVWIREADVALGSLMSLQLLAPAAAVIAAVLLSSCKPEEAPSPPPRTARVIEAVPAPLLLAAEGSGTIASRTSTSVGFLVSGRLDTRAVDVGDVVTTGEVLAAIDPTDLKNQLDSAKTAVDAANASVMQTAAEEAAKRQLLKEGFTTQSEYNDALRALQTAQADLANAQANVRLAEDQLEYATLKSPVAGAVTTTGADPGQVIQAGQMIVTIADTGALDAVFSVPAQLANVARIGGVVSVWLQQDPNIKTTGKVRQIAPDADQTTGTYTIKVALENPPPEMRLGALVRGRAEQTGEEVISIPPTALVQTGDTPQVWIVSADGSVHLKPVTVARYDTGAVLISDGIETGDLVVIAGVNSLAEGQIVTVEKVAAP
jgi:RND family efflux transporter MFP subunit